MPTSQHEFTDAATVSATEEYRRKKVTSVLAIVFTDIAGSTELREKHGEVAYERMREEHDEAVRGTIESENAGALVKSTGDGALAVFSEPSTAVLRALAIQELLASHPQFRLRIGIDMGQVSVVSSGGIVADIFGRQVNRAARIQALSEPGHVLTSFHVYDCAVGWLMGTNVKWHNHGSRVLKGFADEVSIHEAFDAQRITPQPMPPYARDRFASVLCEAGIAETHSLEAPTEAGPWQLRVYENHQILHAEEFSGTIEVGRQIAPDELLTSTQLPNGRRRIAVARIDDHNFARRHLLLEPHGDELQVTNLSAAQPVGLPDGKKLEPNARVSIPLPALLTVGRKVIRVQAIDRIFDEELCSASMAGFIQLPLGASLYGRRGPGGIVPRSLTSVMPGSPLESYGKAIGGAIAPLNRLSNQTYSILWVDDFPENATSLRIALEAAGCRVDVSLSTFEAVRRISTQQYHLILSDMGRGDNPTAGLELLDWLRINCASIPTIIYCTPRGVGRHGEAAIAKGAVLCTAGLVTFFDGILQVVRQQFARAVWEDYAANNPETT